jgi:hypothetical protein
MPASSTFGLAIRAGSLGGAGPYALRHDSGRCDVTNHLLRTTQIPRPKGLVIGDLLALAEVNETALGSARLQYPCGSEPICGATLLAPVCSTRISSRRV